MGSGLQAEPGLPGAETSGNQGALETMVGNIGRNSFTSDELGLGSLEQDDGSPLPLEISVRKDDRLQPSTGPLTSQNAA